MVWSDFHTDFLRICGKPVIECNEDHKPREHCRTTSFDLSSELQTSNPTTHRLWHRSLRQPIRNPVQFFARSQKLSRFARLNSSLAMPPRSFRCLKAFWQALEIALPVLAHSAQTTAPDRAVRSSSATPSYSPGVCLVALEHSWFINKRDALILF